MVGAVRKCPRKVIGDARHSNDELDTLLTEIECKVKSRPLTYHYKDPEEVQIPPHVIYGPRLPPPSDNFQVDSDPETL